MRLQVFDWSHGLIIKCAKPKWKSVLFGVEPDFLYWCPFTFLCFHVSLALNYSIFISPQMCRESVYQVLSQTTPENTSKNYASYSINPRTRYTRVNLSSIQTNQVRTLILYLLNTDLNQGHFNPRGGYPKMRITVQQSRSHKSKAMLTKCICCRQNKSLFLHSGAAPIWRW